MVDSDGLDVIAHPVIALIVCFVWPVKFDYVKPFMGFWWCLLGSPVFKTHCAYPTFKYVCDPTMTVPLKHWISHDSWPSWPFGKRPSARLYRVASLDKMKEDWSNAKRHLQWQRETFEKKNAVKQGSRKRSLSATLKSERGGHIIPNKLGKTQD